MSRSASAAGFLVLALLSARAFAEEPEVTVKEDRLAIYDLGALKAGDWVESEMVSKYEGSDESKSKFKMACVGVDGDKVSIEETASDTVTLFVVSKSTRKVTEAWEGEAGKVGKKLKVVPADAKRPPAKNPNVTATGKVSRETLKINGKEFDCEKVVVTVTAGTGDVKAVHTSTTWDCDQLPFRRQPDENAMKDDDTKWDGKKPSFKGAIVKWLHEAKDGTSTSTVTGWGTDAKPTLKTK